MSDEALFTEAEVYDGDPLQPDLERVTPPSVVACLSPADRVRRVKALMALSYKIIDLAIAEHGVGKKIVAKCVMWSGGNDSNTLAHLVRPIATHVVMANTTIGIEETRQFVRDQAAAWGLPLIEKVAPISYDELVIERGFPGPAMHFKMWQRLKERCFRAALHDLGVSGSRTKKVLYMAGRRREESEQRADAPAFEMRGNAIWASPLIMWTKLDLNTYREMFPDEVPENMVASLLHMSGECLCGAYAHPGELDEVGEWFPEVKARIEALQEKVRAAGHPEPFCTWGHGQGGPGKSAPMCGNCVTRWTTPGGLDFEKAS